MSDLDEIVLPETTPETEWVRGRPLQKIGDDPVHAHLRDAFAIALAAWARGRGKVATLRRFRIAPPGEARRPLVPDVSFVANEQRLGYDDDALAMPPFAPHLAVEVVVKRERRIDLMSKIDVYLRAGTQLVIVLDPAKRIAELHGRRGITRIAGEESLQHEALPEFVLPLAAFFAEALNPTA